MGFRAVDKVTRKALEERDHWLTAEWLPKYALELNDIEPTWKTLKATERDRQTFSDIDDLKNTILRRVRNRERQGHRREKSTIPA